MEWSVLFFLNSILLGVGLAMDAFSVSLANGLHEPEMKTGRMSMIAGTFGGFQACQNRFLTRAQTENASLVFRLKRLHAAARMIWAPQAPRSHTCSA